MTTAGNGRAGPEHEGGGAPERAASGTTGGGTPEAVGVSGQPNPAAEAPPTVRARGASRVFSVYTIIAGGLTLLVLTLFADAGATATVANAIIGALIVGLGAAAIAGLGGHRAIGWIGMLAGVPLGISGLLVTPFGLAAAGRLVGGAALFMGSIGLLTATVRPVHGEEEPEPTVEAN
jgi:hypothetical protein